jgi:hypothetical protein
MASGHSKNIPLKAQKLVHPAFNMVNDLNLMMKVRSVHRATIIFWERQVNRLRIKNNCRIAHRAVLCHANEIMHHALHMGINFHGFAHAVHAGNMLQAAASATATLANVAALRKVAKRIADENR